LGLTGVSDWPMRHFVGAPDDEASGRKLSNSLKAKYNHWGNLKTDEWWGSRDLSPPWESEMSRNFELLRRAGKEDDLFGQSGTDSPSNGGAPGPLDPRAPPEQEVIKFVQRVFAFPNSHAPRVVVFSSVQGKGSSEICCGAGEALAAQGSRSVCLVDANLRAPSLHQLLGVGKSPGLADATVKPGPIKDFAVRIAGRDLWLLPPGSLVAEAQGLFASDGLRSRVIELREEFDYVLIDAPPVSSFSDAVLLGQTADGVILVVEANSTRRETARRAKEAFESANVKLLGAILNNRTFPIPEALFRKL
jgi:Mrp family chromosome partitioning ATPase